MVFASNILVYNSLHHYIVSSAGACASVLAEHVIPSHLWLAISVYGFATVMGFRIFVDRFKRHVYVFRDGRLFFIYFGLSACNWIVDLALSDLDFDYGNITWILSVEF